MSFQVLVSTMNQMDSQLISRMNIKSNAIIINQCGEFHYTEETTNGSSVQIYSFNEKGIGLSRNSALMRATAEICLFADDDVVYEDNYKDNILKTFRENTEADVIVFNVPSTNPDRPEFSIKSYSKVRFFNCMRYGTFRIAVRTKSIKSSNIYFSLLFGGGAEYGSGEDTLFLVDCLRRKLKVYASPIQIGTVTHKESTWFSGYSEKYFRDKGALFYTISRMFAIPLCLQFVLRHHKRFIKDKGMYSAFKLMIEGARHRQAYARKSQGA